MASQETNREPFSGLTLALILRPRGLRGEVAAQILTDFPEKLPALREAWLARGNAAPRRIGVDRCWLSPSRGGQAVFHFSGINTPEAAAALRGFEVQVPIEQRSRLEAGNYYVSDLVGCSVWETESAAPLGLVRDVEFPGGVPLLAVETAAGEVLVPLAAEFCTHIDTKAKRIDVALPDGLRDLNAR